MRRALLIAGSRHERLGIDADLALMEAVLEEYRFDVIERCPGPATREVILGALAQLADEVGIEDAVVIYYSGHGGIARFCGPIAGREWPRRDWRYLVPDDPLHSARGGQFRGILDVELAESVAGRLGARCNNVTVILECCFAGGMLAPWPYVEYAGARSSSYFSEFEVPEFLRTAGFWNRVDERRADQRPVVVIAATSESRPSYERRSGRANGRFTAALAAGLRRVQGRSITWGRLIDGVKRQLQLEAEQLCQEPNVIGPLGREVFGARTVDTSREYEVIVTSDGRLGLLAGTLHGLGDGDLVELLDPDDDTALGQAWVREPGPVRAWLEARPPSRRSKRRSLVAVLCSRANSMAVRIEGDTAAMAELRAGVHESPWLELVDADHKQPAVELVVDGKRVCVTDLQVRREAWPNHLGIELESGLDSPLSWVLADLEALARARGFLRACADAPPPPPNIEFWLRVHGPAGERVLGQTGGSVSCGEQIEAGMKYAEKYTGETMFVNLLNLGVDGRLYLHDDHRNVYSRGGFDLRSEDPGEARGVERAVRLSWSEGVPRVPTRESLFFVLTSAKVDLESLTKHQPGLPTRAPPAKADVLDELLQPVELYVHRIDFILRP